jgi:hypothetical protein
MAPRDATTNPAEDRMLELVALRGRPDLLAQVFAGPFMALWPAFMQEDPTADLFFARPHLDACLDCESIRVVRWA